MGKTKELFIQMAQGFVEGLSIERELRGRMADDEYLYALYKKENTTKQITNTTKDEKE
jgi:hypothetical protein